MWVVWECDRAHQRCFKGLLVGLMLFNTLRVRYTNSKVLRVSVVMPLGPQTFDCCPTTPRRQTCHCQRWSTSFTTLPHTAALTAEAVPEEWSQEEAGRILVTVGESEG